MCFCPQRPCLSAVVVSRDNDRRLEFVCFITSIPRTGADSAPLATPHPQPASRSPRLRRLTGPSRPAIFGSAPTDLRAALEAMLAFGTGFVQVLSPDAGTFCGVIVGICLAVAWTMALRCGSLS
jgi:hypothetical protein